MSQDAFCKPRRPVVFKAASSTVLNILYRYGEARNMTFALPFYDHLGYPRLFQATYVKDFGKNSSEEYNILSGEEGDAKTILRNANRLAESAFSYFHAAFREAKSLDRFLSRPDTFYRLSRTNDHYAGWFDLGEDLYGAGADFRPCHARRVL
ncbi:galactose-3-O-sulfotransferase 4-like [Hypanus sabinus]|uniref:galactose-3-O-sulfotransferase 4-like n=1 Tax=Hypanus sabinus TaxID=79690 RepID=UPI0028C44AA0|nr:galactose-3-O-sulfotransferase 4-like [Hypanus sabinus]